MKSPQRMTWLLGFGVLLAVALMIFWLAWHEKSVTMSINRAFTGYYRGLFNSEKRFHRVEVDEGSGVKWIVDIEGEGWNSYRGYYSNGTLREEGEIHVFPNGLNKELTPDRHVVRWGRYYKPDGLLGSEIKDGTGDQILWFPNGQICWHMKQVDGKRVSDQFWHPDGTTHGPVISP